MLKVNGSHGEWSQAEMAGAVEVGERNCGKATLWRAMKSRAPQQWGVNRAPWGTPLTQTRQKAGHSGRTWAMEVTDGNSNGKYRIMDRLQRLQEIEQKQVIFGGNMKRKAGLQGSNEEGTRKQSHILQHQAVYSHTLFFLIWRQRDSLHQGHRQLIANLVRPLPNGQKWFYLSWTQIC